MNESEKYREHLEVAVSKALKEDGAFEDITTAAIEKPEDRGLAKIIAKEDLVVSGLDFFKFAMCSLDPNVQIQRQFQDGHFVLRGQTVATLVGNRFKMLRAERVALNFLGHLSGVATLTSCFVEAISSSKTKILDTRKTTPGLRFAERKAVRDGGGHNHRYNLQSAILIKENHIQLAGSIAHILSRCLELKYSWIEIEVRNLNELQEALKFPIQRVMLDNFDNIEIQNAMNVIPPHIEVEASGNMKIERVKSVADLGVHFISVGALTHSAPCADISFLLE
jgi:nicotinate-nucleotide pyrophosphorylase (carboxylating)